MTARTDNAKNRKSENTSESLKTKDTYQKAADKKMSAKNKEAEQRLRKKRRTYSVILFTAAVFIFFVYIIAGESVWLGLHYFLWGLFGYVGISVPFVMGFVAYQLSKEKLVYRFSVRIVLIALIILFFASAIYLFGFYPAMDQNPSYWSELGRCYMLGCSNQGAGLIGALFGAILAFMFGTIGSRITIILLLFLSVMLATGSSLLRFFETLKKPVDHMGQKVAQQRVLREEERAVRDTEKKRKSPIYIFSDDENVNSSPRNAGGESERMVDVKTVPIYEVPQNERHKKKNTENFSLPVEIDDYTENKTKKSENEEEIYNKESSSDDYGAPQHYEESYDSEVQDDEELLRFLQNQENVDDTEEDPYKFLSAVTNFSQRSTNVKNTKPSNNAYVYTEPPLAADDFELTETYLMPPVSLLEPPSEDDSENISAELKQNSTTLIETLKSFGVNASIINISRGPSVTRYELQPAPGVKISKITNLSDDIALNLAAVGVRIEAPIPGKSAVGIEVPNKNTTIVKMRGLIESPEFINAKSKLTVALGYDIAGKIILADLAKMPHLLIAGSTGSGKSVCINSMLISLLYKANPDEVKLMLIDPKVVELGVYNGIPHLLVPVVTDPRKASGALSWAVNEMLKRYNMFAECNVRDIRGYNRLVEKQNSEVDEWEETHAEEAVQNSFEEDEMLAQAQAEISEKEENTPPKRLTKMPQVVIIIDELADLMMAAPNEVEESICRLAQMARAAGMHLVIATQRPSVDVITGLIKANVPSRIAFAVKSQVDSRTILDGGGAEKLLGRGDMLYSPIGTNKPTRVQGCFVDDNEIERVIDFIKQSQISEYDDNIIDEIEKNAPVENSKNTQDNANVDLDPVMEDAIKCVVEAGQASTSLLQRRLRLGYARAGRLIDEMEQMGIVGPYEGSKPRQVLMSYQQWLERNMARKE